MLPVFQIPATNKIQVYVFVRFMTGLLNGTCGATKKTYALRRTKNVFLTNEVMDAFFFSGYSTATNMYRKLMCKEDG